MERDIRAVYSEVVDIVQDGFQFADFVSVLGLIMRVIQTRRQWQGHGATKKQVAVAVFQLYLTESGLLSEEEALAAASFLLTTLPALVDELKAIARDLAAARPPGRLSGWACCGGR